MEKQNNRERTIIISGTGKVSKESNIYKQYGDLQINIEFYPSSLEIVSIAITCPVPDCAGKNKLKEILVGSKVEEGIKNSIKMLKEEIFCINKRVVIRAVEHLKVNYNKYKDKNGNSVNTTRKNNNHRRQNT